MSGAIVPLIVPIDGNPLGLDFTDPVFLLDSAGRKITDSHGRPIVVYNRCQFLTDSLGRRITDSHGRELQVNVTDLGVEIEELSEFTLPPDLDVDWSLCGVGGNGVIPDLSANRVNAVTTYGVVEGLGAGSQTAALQAAIDAEAANRTPGSESTTTRQVFLPAGDYLLSTQIRVVGVELVGEPGTVLHITQQPTFDAGLGTTRHCDVDDTDIAKGATSAIISGAEANLFTNGQAFLSQEDSAGVDSVGVETTWSANGFTPVRNKGFAISVSNHVDNGDGTYTITWQDPAPFSLTGTIGGHRYSVVSKYAGIRDLTIRSKNLASPIGTGFEFARCEHVWLKNVTFRMFNTRHALIRSSSNVQIEGCNFEESRQLVPGGGYGIEVHGFPSRCLVRDNTIVGMRTPIVLSGGSHNAWLENYLAYPVNLNAKILQKTLSVHAAHPRGNLFEGNIVEGSAGADNIHGNMAGNVWFRNRIVGRGQDARHGAYTTTYNIALRLDQKALDHVVVGNVLGWSGMSGNYEVQSPSAPPISTPAIHRWQYASDGQPVGDLTDLNLTLTANYDYINNATQYDENGAVALPESLYYTSGNLPSHLPVVNFETAELNVTPLPAKARFEAAGGRESLVMANESSLILLNTAALPGRRYQDVWVDDVTNTVFAAVLENNVEVYDLNQETYQMLYIKTISANSNEADLIHQFDGVLWVGGADGKFSAILPSNNDGVFVEGANLTGIVMGIADNGSYLIVTNGYLVRSIRHDGGGSWTEIDSVAVPGNPWIAGLTVFGGDIFVTERTGSAGHIYHITIDGAGALTVQGNVADSVNALYGMYADADNLYAGILSPASLRHYTRVGGALSLQADYPLPARAGIVRRNGNRLYVPTGSNELVVFDINPIDGTLTERTRTVGLNTGEGSYPFGSYHVAYAAGAVGLSILEDV